MKETKIRFILQSAITCLFLGFSCSAYIRSESNKRYSSADVKNFVVWAIFEPVYTKEDIEAISLIKPDILCRAWFRWDNDLDAFNKYKWVVDSIHKMDIAFQGGTTCKAINTKLANFTPEMAAHGENGKPVSVHKGVVPEEIVFMNLYHPKAREYVLKDAKQQIDLGVDGIWFDEVGNFYNYNEGTLDDVVTKQFTEFLVDKYVKQRGWSLDDKRWGYIFKIDLAEFGSNIENFDLRQYLKEFPAVWKILNNGQAKPEFSSESNEAPLPILREYGYPNEWYVEEGTFYYTYTLKHWKELALATKEYAQQTYGFDPIITKNMINLPVPYVSFQQPQCLIAMFPLKGSRLDATQDPSWLLDDVMKRSFKASGDVPIVWFVDWPGQINALLGLSVNEQKIYFKIYVAEAYAHGQFFALPFKAYYYDARKAGTFSLLLYLSKFYRKYSDLFVQTKRIIKNEAWALKARALNLPMISNHTASISVSRKDITTTIYEKNGKLIIHLVNHNYAASIKSMTKVVDLNINLKTDFDFIPNSVRLISPDFPNEESLDFVQDRYNIRVYIPRLEYYDIIVLQ